jgi:hypothetical protein
LHNILLGAAWASGDQVLPVDITEGSAGKMAMPTDSCEWYIGK